jgi:hypothetical protein
MQGLEQELGIRFQTKDVYSHRSKPRCGPIDGSRIIEHSQVLLLGQTHGLLHPSIRMLILHLQTHELENLTAALAIAVAANQPLVLYASVIQLVSGRRRLASWIGGSLRYASSQSATRAGVVSTRGAALSGVPIASVAAAVVAAGPLFDDLLLDVAPPWVRVPVGLARLAAGLPVHAVVVVGGCAHTGTRAGERSRRLPERSGFGREGVLS